MTSWWILGWTTEDYEVKNYVLSAEAGNYNVSDSSIILLKNFILDALYSDTSILGSSINLFIETIISPETGSFSFSGHNSLLSKYYIFSVDSGSFTIFGTSSELLLKTLLTCGLGEVTLTGSNLNLLKSSVIDVIVSPTVDTLISLFKVYYSYFDVQTSEEYGNSDNTDADILYEHFGVYYELAEDELINLVDARHIELTITQEKVALCHLIADYVEQGNPDWNFRSQSMGSGVSFSRGEKTGPREALTKLLDSVELATKATRRPSTRMGASDIKHVKDSTNYPRRFKKTALPSWNFSEDGFDSEEVPDVGGNYTDRTY